MIKRTSTIEERVRIKAEAKFKKRDEKSLSDKEIKEIIILIAKKLNIL